MLGDRALVWTVEADEADVGEVAARGAVRIGVTIVEGGPAGGDATLPLKLDTSTWTKTNSSDERPINAPAVAAPLFV